jgi:hypothetical protein
MESQREGRTKLEIGGKEVFPLQNGVEVGVRGRGVYL